MNRFQFPGGCSRRASPNRKFSGGSGRGHHPKMVRQIAAITGRRRRFRQQGPTGTRQQPGIGRRQRTEGQARVICAAVGWAYWTPPEDQGSGEGHPCRGGPDILDATKGSRT
ncbi:hypothetical protein DPMN_122039 [Dreissena polymorpha]|uniref:Uncharacterized protein n=1 Tax=Dreissena polymorpha TaxID=45954 RepID=A0A9D4JTR2_DREPO|nr:hypothetical protein DPMN_122039 [Dreissena polymorpha]